MPLPPLTEKDFNEIVKSLRKEHPKLKIRIFRKRDRLPSGANGEYGWGQLDIAVGRAKSEGWPWMIGVLAHEYSHYLREKRHSAFYNNQVYRANHRFYSSHLSHAVRSRAMFWVVRDEYYTDVEASEILKKWGLWDYFKNNWWRWAASYNYRIKYYLETGEFISGIDDIVKTPNRRLSYSEIMKPLSTRKKREIAELAKNYRKAKVDED